MKLTNFISFIIFASLFMCNGGCKTQHKLDIDVNKPIKVEARIDIFVHAATIEDMVKGKIPIPEVQKPPQPQLHSFLTSFLEVKKAYAKELPFKEVNKEIRDALAKRKERYPKIKSFLSKGKVKEGMSGYLEIVSNLNKQEQKLVKEENKDRRFIYIELSKQHNISLKEVEKTFGAVHK